MLALPSNDNLQRPHKPTPEFLKKILIGDLPDDVDVTFNDAAGHLTYIPGPNKTIKRAAWTSARSFTIAQVDDFGTPVRSTIIPAFESAVRPSEIILADLHAALVTEYGATPAIEPKSKRPRANRPTEEFLKRADITHLPFDVDVVFRDSEVDCARAFEIRKINPARQVIIYDEVSARETRARSEKHIYRELHEVLTTDFGAVGRHAFEIPGEFRQVSSGAVPRVHF